MNGRIYDPLLGRMLSPDPYLKDSLDPQNYNRYTYVLNNPLRFIDPTGYYEEDVHRDLTFSLAVRVGFSKTEARAIAAADQGVDDSPVTGPFVSKEARRDFHFTTPGRRREMLQMANKAGSLTLFGVYLHAEQDSYSHQRGLTDRDGEPYDPDTGHLSAGHDPDKTYLRPELALKMAEDTYQKLRDFYERTHGKKSDDEWKKIRTTIQHWVKIVK